ncbi:MAG: hypothetical protein LEGION0398_MBIBDBAK_00182 [Legionellaceae bacterium]
MLKPFNYISTEISPEFNQKIDETIEIIAQYNQAKYSFNGSTHVTSKDIIENLNNAQSAQDFLSVSQQLQSISKNAVFNQTQKEQDTLHNLFLSKESAEPFWDTVPKSLHQRILWLDEYSAHSNLALFVSIELIERLEKFLNALQNEKEALANKEALIRYLEHVQTEKMRLARGILHRLQFSSLQPDFRHTDVLYGIGKELQENSVQGITLPSAQRNNLTADTFHLFIEFIQKYGASNERKLLETLNWQIPKKTSLEFAYIVREGDVLTVPRGIVATVPKSKGFSFERGRNTRYQQARNLHELVYSLNEDKQFETEEALFSYQFKLWRDCQCKISQLLNEDDANIPTGIRRFFLGKTITQTKHYQAFLNRARASILENQIALLEKVADNAATQNKLPKEIAFSLQESESMLKETLDSLPQDNENKASLLTRYEEALSIIHANDPKRRQAQNLFQEIHESYSPTKKKAQKAYDFHDEIKKTPEKKPEGYDASIRQTVEEVKNRIIVGLFTHEAKAGEPASANSRLLINIHRDIRTVKKIGNTDDLVDIKNALNAYVNRYMKALCAALDDINPTQALKENAPIFLEHEAILITLSKKGATLHDAYLYYHLCLLTQYRLTKTFQELKPLVQDILEYTKSPIIQLHSVSPCYSHQKMSDADNTEIEDDNIARRLDFN